MSPPAPAEALAASAPSRLTWGLALIALSGFFLPYLALLPGWGVLNNGLHLLDWQRCWQAGIVIVALLVGGLRPLPLSRRLAGLWGLVALSGLLSCYFAVYPWAALLDWAWLHALVLLVLVAAAAFEENAGAARRLIEQSVLLTTVLYLFWFFAINSDYLFAYDFRFTEPGVPGFAASRYFSDWQAILLFLLPLAWRSDALGKPWRWPALLLIALMFAMAFQQGARSIWFGQVIAHGLLLLALGRAYLPYLRRMAVCWGLGYLLYVGLFQLYAPWSLAQGAPGEGTQTVAPEIVASARYDSSGRGELLVKAGRLTAEHPVLGVGGRHYGCYKKADFSDPHNRYNGDVTHPHNAVAQLASEWGLPTAVLLCALLAHLLWRLRAACRADGGPQAMDTAMAGALLALLAHALVNGTINAPATQMGFVLLLGWAIWRAGLPGQRFSLRWPALGLVVLIVMLLSRELPQLPEMNRGYSANEPPTWYLAPRFWQQGWLLPLCGKI